MTPLFKLNLLFPLALPRDLHCDLATLNIGGIQIDDAVPSSADFSRVTESLPSMNHHWGVVRLWLRIIFLSFNLINKVSDFYYLFYMSWHGLKRVASISDVIKVHIYGFNAGMVWVLII